MKLYAEVASDRARKGQGGNKYVEVQFTYGKSREVVGLVGLYEDGRLVFEETDEWGKHQTKLLKKVQVEKEDNCDCNKNLGNKDLLGSHDINCNLRKGQRRKSTLCNTCRTGHNGEKCQTVGCSCELCNKGERQKSV